MLGIIRTVRPSGLIDLGDAVAQTKGLAQMGAPDSVQGQKYHLTSLAGD
jgi:hypothetical protein